MIDWASINAGKKPRQLVGSGATLPNVGIQRPQTTKDDDQPESEARPGTKIRDVIIPRLKDNVELQEWFPGISNRTKDFHKLDEASASIVLNLSIHWMDLQVSRLLKIIRLYRAGELSEIPVQIFATNMGRFIRTQVEATGLYALAFVKVNDSGLIGSVRKEHILAWTSEFRKWTEVYSQAQEIMNEIKKMEGVDEAFLRIWEQGVMEDIGWFEAQRRAVAEWVQENVKKPVKDAVKDALEGANEAADELAELLKKVGVGVGVVVVLAIAAALFSRR